MLWRLEVFQLLGLFGIREDFRGSVFEILSFFGGVVDCIFSVAW